MPTIYSQVIASYLSKLTQIYLRKFQPWSENPEYWKPQSYAITKWYLEIHINDAVNEDPIIQGQPRHLAQFHNYFNQCI